MKSAKEIRTSFLVFFESKSHTVVPSAPIVVKDDPTLMFTNAGMNQFKDNFLGLKPPKADRIANTQKCLRVSGKHNDLEEVGHDTYHHTMFEMLGNWSFGEYYKAEAIEWAWELLTEVYGIDKEKLYVTVFGGDEGDGLGVDEEAVNEWKKWVPEDRILKAGKKDNFWEMGETGPCGPCSEIHIDMRPQEEIAKIPGHKLVNEDHPQVIELWNLVFMEFNRKADQSLEPLPAKHVDTGLGFERLVRVLQGYDSNYDSDVFSPYKSWMEENLGQKYGESEDKDIAMRVIMDHLRAVTFTIADGQLPSNTGAGYVIRRILRRASRYGFQFLGQNQPFIHKMVPILAKEYDEVFPEVSKQVDFIVRILEEEEKSFLRTLETGTKKFEEYVGDASKKDKTIDGEFAFTLYDRFGFPIDLTQLMAREIGWDVGMAGFETGLKQQKERSRAASEQTTGDWTVVHETDDLPVFTGYETTEGSGRITQFRSVKTKKSNIHQVVLDNTPFYAESGGQVGDTGTISNGTETLKVLDVKKENELIVHFTDKLPQDATGDWTLTVDAERRRLIKANHSATHLLHASLRKVLGDHVEQRGSLVSDEVLRFDFSHFAAMTDEEIQKVEEMVNSRIAMAIALDERRDVPIDEAKKMGAMALFGEKYGESVRVIMFDQEFSTELCGGTHVNNTGEIRLFKLVTESSIAAGVRRVECLTSDGALAYLNGKENLLGELMETLKNPKDPVKAIAGLLEEKKALEKQLEAFNKEKISGLRESLKSKGREVGGLNLLNEVVEVGSADDLKTLCFNLRQSMENTLVVLGAVVNDKPMLQIILTEDLEASGKYNAGSLVRELAKEISGGGGGQPFYASAGGSNAAGLATAVKKIEEFIN